MKITPDIKEQAREGKFSKELRAYLAKLQKELTDPGHIVKVNRLIPEAVMIATGDRDKERARYLIPENPAAYHAAMNQLTKAAGLRSF